VDTAVFSGPRADYDFTPNINRTQMTVVHARGTQLDGTDIVRNVERLTFADQTVLIAPVASLAPASLTFATRAVNTTSPTQNATLANTGTSPLTISGAALNGAHPADYQIASTTCGATLAAGAQCLYRVAFRPTAPGTRTSSLRVTHDSGNVAGSTSVTTLTGTGTAPIATLTPASRTFAPQPLNNTSAPQTATLQNTGIGTLAIASIAFVGPNAAEFARVPGGCGASLAANASCTITFTFRPTAVGSRTASLRVTSNSGGNAGTTSDMPVDGTGVNAPALSAAATQAFGTSQLPGLLSGGTVQNRTITFTSTGQLPAIITTATIGPAATGSAPADYTVTGGTCQNTTRNVGATCTVVVRLRASATGARNATLILNSNSPVSPTRVNLTGTGTQPLL
jgi:hypothetical protein